MNAAFFKKSMLLHVAKKHLSHLNPMGLCQAIHLAARELNTPIALDAAEELQAEIDDLLYPFVYAHSWLGWKMTYPQYKAKDHAMWPSRVYDRAYDWGTDVSYHNPQGLQAWRHAWLDRMLKEYVAKERREEQNNEQK